MKHPPAKKRRRRILLAIACLVAITAAAVLLAVKYRIGPAKMESQLRASLGEYWAGTVSADNIEFNLIGNPKIGYLELIDAAGRRWLAAEEVSVQIDNRFSANPSVTKLSAQKVEISGFVRDGEFDIKIRPSLEVGEKAAKLLAVEVGSLTFKLDVVHGQRQMSLQPLCCEGMSLTSQKDGRIIAAIRSGALMVKDRGVPFADAKVCVAIEGRGANLSDFSCSALSGNVRGAVKIANLSKLGGAGELAFEKISAADLARLINPTWIITKGVAHGRASFRLDGMTIDNLNGTVSGFIDDCDMEKIELCASLMRQAKIKPEEIAGTNDIIATCKFNWPTVVIENMRVANKKAAFVIEPGGKINIPERTMDMYIIDGRIDDLRKVSLGMDLLATLTRFHITGRWDIPQSQTIEWAQMENVDPSHAMFMQQAGSSQGAMGSGILDLLLVRKNGATKPANGHSATAPKTQPAANGSSSTSKSAG